MREIKFRSWDINDNKIRTYKMKRYDNLHIMQYTGLKDKNGKDIYEGDVITFEWQQVRELRASDYRIIKWITDEGRFNWVDAETEESTSGWSFCKKCSEKYAEIIGNIYENPDLLNI